jgi:hypothetical protein
MISPTLVNTKLLPRINTITSICSQFFIDQALRSKQVTGSENPAKLISMFNYFNFVANIIKVIKSRRMKWA